MQNEKFPQVCIVEASAGSGKTYALAKRYLRLLINPHIKLEHIPLRGILAITFTNKATVEMKERILELLKKIALDAFTNKEEEKDILEGLGVDKKFAKSKASLIMKTLIKHYNFFGVQTIDSFINHLLLGCALHIDRSASFKIKKDYTQYLLYCFDLLVEQAAVKKEVFDFLEEFLQHYLFVENKDGWFPKEDILKSIKFLFRLANKYGRFFHLYPGESIDVIKTKRHIYGLIEELSQEFPQGLSIKVSKAILSFLKKNNPIFDISSLPDALKSQEVKVNKGHQLSSRFNKKWKRVYKELAELIELDAMVAYKPYVKLFQQVLDSFHFVSKKEDMLFLEELNRQARLLFYDEGITVAEVYYRLAARFKHFLIDEFQDTSVLQWHNFEIMIEDCLAGGGSLFYVGDKKQAIYRFRGGEAELFDAVKNKFSHFNIETNHLTKNWRSQKAIVDFNNKVFSKENLISAIESSGISKELEQDRGASSFIVDIYKDAVQQGREENAAGFVRVEHIDEKNQQERNDIMREKVVSLVQDLNGRFSYEDIAVLARDNNEVELITSWFLEQGVPVESEKTLNVLENSLVREVISFLKFLHSPIDDLNFAAFILGDVFTKSTGVSNTEITQFIFSLRREGKLNRTASLYRLFRSAFPGIWEKYIIEFFKNVGFISTYELLTNIYQRFSLVRNFREQQAFFMKLLELARFNEDDCPGLGEFLTYLEESASAEDLYVKVCHSDSVKVLTVHKAKGLEFPVVIIPFLRMDISPETGEKGMNSYVVEDDELGLGLLRITKTHREFSPLLQKIYVHNYKKACIDELNNMYVALTRAQYELYVFIPRKSGASNNKARVFISTEITQIGNQQRYERKTKQTQPFINISPCDYKDWITGFRNELEDVGVIKNRERIIEGNVMHFMLSKIDNLCLDKKKNVIKEAVKSARRQFSFFKDFASIEEKVSSLVDRQDLKPFFYVSRGKVYREKEVVNRFGDLKRIDRLIVTDNEVWIIDYKTSPDFQEKYAGQIKEYMEIVKDIYPKHKIKGYIIYFDEMSVVPVIEGVS
jgi:ATP-dependent exoDNAse (exonuclease V) beta subunit